MKIDQSLMKSFKESDPPEYINPALVTEPYLLMPLRFVKALGNSNVPKFVGDTLASAWPELWQEVRRLQPNIKYNGLCIPDNVKPDPKIGIDDVDEHIDTSCHSIICQTFQLLLSNESPITVYGGFCFPDRPGRILFPMKGKLKPQKNKHDNESIKESNKGTTTLNKKWFQFWK
jgi:hypothetical protein